METKGVRDREFLIDLESGNNAVVSEHDDRVGQAQARAALGGVWNGLTGTDVCSRDERNQLTNCCPSLSLEAVAKNGEDRKSEGEEKVELLENSGGEKPKKKRSKKPPRPPRPPTHSPLDAADQKLISELSELATLKRARIERMKALKKMKNTKPTSSSSNLCALIITIIFCLVILWQGVFPRHGLSTSFHGSPESSVGAHGGLISVRFYKKSSRSISPGSSASPMPNDTGTVSKLKISGEASTVAG